MSEPPPDGCAWCQSTTDVTFGPDPFRDEVYGDETPLWLCAECRWERRQEV